MRLKISPSLIKGEIDAPKSKSIAIRILFGSLLNNIILKDKIPQSDDVKYALESVLKMGVIYEGNSLRKPDVPDLKNKFFYAGGSATVARILLSLALVLGGEIVVDGDASLRQRPFDGILGLSKNLKSYVSGKNLPIKIKGNSSINYIELPELESSQYVTGLIFGLAIKGGGTIKLPEKIPSLYYIMLTLDKVNELGCEAKLENNEIIVNNCKEKINYVSFPGDYLISSFYAISSLLTGGFTIIDNLYLPPSYYGDHKIVDILSTIGAKSKVVNNKWIVESNEISGKINVDIDETPDMAMSLAPLGIKLNVEINGIERLKIKESDRIKSIKETLEAFGSKVTIKNNKIVIQPNVLKYGEIDCNKDHRVAMIAATLSFLKGGIINGAECINKSDPDHFERYRSLGGNITYE